MKEVMKEVTQAAAGARLPNHAGETVTVPLRNLCRTAVGHCCIMGLNPHYCGCQGASPFYAMSA
jgi:hypothetical protein